MITIGSVLNERYKVDGLIGTGGMSLVYKGKDLELSRTVAIKILKRKTDPNSEGPDLLERFPELRERFKNEARFVANFSHPNIVIVYDTGTDSRSLSLPIDYIIMEFVDGQDLKKHIRASAPFSVSRALNIAIQICSGIDYAHRTGFVHADIKPQNILIVTDTDTVKITDFGIAQSMLTGTQSMSAVDPSMKKEDVVWGSPQYFSPEQASGGTPTPASDVYSIGIVLYEMLSGKLPFVGADQRELALAHVRDRVPHVREVMPSVPADLDFYIHKAMSKEPTARYASAGQLGRLLLDLQKKLEAGTGGVNVISPAAQQSIPPIRPNVGGSGTGNAPAGPTGSISQQPQPIGGGQGSQGGQSAPRIVQVGTPPSPSGPVNPYQTSGPVNPPSGAQAPSVPRTTLPNAPGRVSQPPYTVPSSGNAPQPPAMPNIPAPIQVGGSRPQAPVQGGTGSYAPNLPTTPPTYAGYGQPAAPYAGQPPAAPLGAPQYGVAPSEPIFDMATVLLGIIAAGAVLGLIVLWLAVWGAWA